VKNLFFLTVLTLFLFSFDTSEDCEQMYSNAAYGVMHSKKAYQARNYDDQRYFAQKALDAYQRVQESIDNCGCSVLTEKVEDAIYYLETAADPKDWDKGRYFSKKVYLSSLDIIAEMDELTAATVIEE